MVNDLSHGLESRQPAT